MALACIIGHTYCTHTHTYINGIHLYVHKHAQKLSTHKFKHPNTHTRMCLKSTFVYPSSLSKANVHHKACCVWYLHIHSSPVTVRAFGKSMNGNRLFVDVLLMPVSMSLCSGFWECCAPKAAQLLVVYSNPPHISAWYFTSVCSQQS